MATPRPRFVTLNVYSRRMAVAIAGAGLGVIVDRLTKGNAGISALTLLVVCTALIALFFAFEEQSRSMSGLRGLTEKEATQLHAQIAELRQHLSVHVTLQTVRDLNTFADISSDVVAQAMLGAKRELLVVDLLPPSGARPDASTRPDLLDDQWAAMIRLPQENPQLSYRRLCQVQTSGSALAIPPLEPAFAAHCADMLDLKQKLGARVSLRFAPMKYPYKFMIVDGNTLILELHRFEKDGADPVVDKEMVIGDPTGDIVSVFRVMWDDLADRPETRAAVEGDLT